MVEDPTLPLAHYKHQTLCTVWFGCCVAQAAQLHSVRYAAPFSHSYISSFQLIFLIMRLPAPSVISCMAFQLAVSIFLAPRTLTLECSLLSLVSDLLFIRILLLKVLSITPTNVYSLYNLVLLYGFQKGWGDVSIQLLIYGISNRSWYSRRWKPRHYFIIFLMNTLLCSTDFDLV